LLALLRGAHERGWGKNFARLHPARASGPSTARVVIPIAPGLFRFVPDSCETYKILIMIGNVSFLVEFSGRPKESFEGA
jgi:hypothetical protein